jgi:hypothetical protein
VLRADHEMHFFGGNYYQLVVLYIDGFQIVAISRTPLAPVGQIELLARGVLFL